MTGMLRQIAAMCGAAVMVGIASVEVGRAAERPAFDRQNDIEYAQVDGHRLLLDLYLPHAKGEKRPPLVIWVHGGAWRSGSKSPMPLEFLVEAGYAVASVDYRLSPVARFPAQIHDLKAAIRFLRAEQEKFGYDALRIGIAGSSAGGHLVALVGTTGGNEELEGKVGTHPDQSSVVQAIVDLYGPTNFMTILHQSTPHGLSVRVPALQRLLGSQPEDDPALAKLASPVFHVDKSDPPLWILHGDQDPQVPINQSHELEGAYRRLGLEVHFEVVHGAAHGGKEFFDASRAGRMREFLDRHLRSASAP